MIFALIARKPIRALAAKPMRAEDMADVMLGVPMATGIMVDHTLEQELVLLLLLVVGPADRSLAEGTGVVSAVAAVVVDLVINPTDPAISEGCLHK